jgi:glycosyltransferase involved in cell wall biosynthesis
VTFFGVELTWMDRQLPFLAPVLRAIIRNADLVTAISFYTAERVRRHVPSVDPVIIPFGATVEAPSEPSPPRTDPTAPCEFLFVGRLVERKGVHLLLEALARLDPAGPVTLRIVGDGPERGRLEGLVATLALRDRVTFEGFVPAETLQARLAGCDCFVLPAVVDAKGDTEGLGVVLLEAMSYGKPVVASAAGGIVDIVQDGENGWLVPPGNVQALAGALASVIADPNEARARGIRGREDVAARFSWQVIVERLVAAYRRVTMK